MKERLWFTDVGLLWSRWP